MAYKVVLIWRTGTVTAEPRVCPAPTPSVDAVIAVETATGQTVKARVIKIGAGPLVQAPVGGDVVQAVEIGADQ